MVISTHMVKTRENTIAKFLHDEMVYQFVWYNTSWLSGCQMQMPSCNTVNHNNSVSLKVGFAFAVKLANPLYLYAVSLKFLLRFLFVVKCSYTTEGHSMSGGVDVWSARLIPQ